MLTSLSMKWYFSFKRNEIFLPMEFERAGFSDHMMPENQTKYDFIQHFLSHPVCLAGISIVSSEICNCLQTEIWVWRLVPSPFHKPRCWGIRLALQAHGPMETLWQARGLVQPHGTPAKVPKLISCFVTQELQTTVVFRGLRVLIEDKVSKYHEVTRFQNRSGNFKEQHIAAWIEQIILWSVEENKHIGVESSQQTNHKHSETNWILAG